MDGLRCIDDFTLRCLDREHRAYFNTLYAGTTQVIVDLCQEGTYQSGKQDNKLRDISMPLSCEVGMSRVNGREVCIRVYEKGVKKRVQLKLL